MKYQDHPTWRMLEKSKQHFKTAVNDIPRFHPLHRVVKEAHDSVVRLQLALEDKLLKEMSGEN